MKNLLFIIALAFLSSCGGGTTATTPNTTQDSGKMSLDSIPGDGQQEYAANEPEIPTNEATMTTQPAGRELQYLFYSNGGLLGFFTDGSVAGCPRCDLCTENVAALKRRKPHATYKAEETFLYFINEDGSKEKMDFEMEDDMDGWAMLKGEWKKTVESCGAE